MNYTPDQEQAPEEVTQQHPLGRKHLYFSETRCLSQGTKGQQTVSKSQCLIIETRFSLAHSAMQPGQLSWALLQVTAQGPGPLTFVTPPSSRMSSRVMTQEEARAPKIEQAAASPPSASVPPFGPLSTSRSPVPWPHCKGGWETHRPVCPKTRGRERLAGPVSAVACLDIPGVSCGLLQTSARHDLLF